MEAPIPLFMDGSAADHQSWVKGNINGDHHHHQAAVLLACSGGSRQPPPAATMTPTTERRLRPQHDHALKCPRCDSTHTKFCYYNNYSLSQPRYFCKTCRRYWTNGGTLRNVPVGGGCRRKNKTRPPSSSIKNNKPPQQLLLSDQAHDVLGQYHLSGFQYDLTDLHLSSSTFSPPEFKYSFGFDGPPLAPPVSFDPVDPIGDRAIDNNSLGLFGMDGAASDNVMEAAANYQRLATHVDGEIKSEGFQSLMSSVDVEWQVQGCSSGVYSANGFGMWEVMIGGGGAGSSAAI